ncbi:hypothetical protein Dm11a5_0514 [Dehalococcoides mccartyi]|uniref:Uncharacterized protein n=1 Tax=Dehalococcoides mccartyi TaxID=61435 RepID=A0A142V934_9CHLR|nr:hypothetical protein Dm11a5_0514 [Dehalococcoides mccartyi]
MKTVVPEREPWVRIPPPPPFIPKVNPDRDFYLPNQGFLFKHTRTQTAEWAYAPSDRFSDYFSELQG